MSDACPIFDCLLNRYRCSTKCEEPDTSLRYQAAYSTALLRELQALVNWIHAHASAAHDWSGIWIGIQVDHKSGSVARGQKAGGMSCKDLEGTASNTASCPAKRFVIRIHSKQHD